MTFFHISPQDTCSSVLFFKVSFLSHKKTKAADNKHFFKKVPLSIYFNKRQFTLKDSLL